MDKVDMALVEKVTRAMKLAADRIQNSVTALQERDDDRQSNGTFTMNATEIRVLKDVRWGLLTLCEELSPLTIVLNNIPFTRDKVAQLKDKTAAAVTAGDEYFHLGGDKYSTKFAPLMISFLEEEFTAKEVKE